MLHILPVQGVGGTCQGARAQGQAVGSFLSVVHAPYIPQEHLEPYQKPVSQGDGLGTLQVRIAGHHVPVMFLRKAQQRFAQLNKGLERFIAGVLHIQAHVGGHLVVAAAAGMQLLARVADFLRQQAFHQHMDILRRGLQAEATILKPLQDILKALADFIPLLLGQDAHLDQHGGMGQAALDVLFVQAAVKGQGGVEIIHNIGCMLLEASAPKFHLSPSYGRVLQPPYAGSP